MVNLNLKYRKFNSEKKNEKQQIQFWKKKWKTKQTSILKKEKYGKSKL